jgi:vesicle-fusing ATPase
MPEQKSTPVQATNAYEDFTGVSTSSFDNPYEALIAACNNDVVS